MDDFIEDFTDLQHQVEAAQQLVAERVKTCFKGKGITMIKAIIHEDPYEILVWLVEIGLQSESYEICAAAQQVIDARKHANDDSSSLVPVHQ